MSEQCPLVDRTGTEEGWILFLKPLLELKSLFHCHSRVPFQSLRAHSYTCLYICTVYDAMNKLCQATQFVSRDEDEGQTHSPEKKELSALH